MHPRRTAHLLLAVALAAAGCSMPTGDDARAEFQAGRSALDRGEYRFAFEKLGAVAAQSKRADPLERQVWLALFEASLFVRLRTDRDTDVGDGPARVAARNQNVLRRLGWLEERFGRDASTYVDAAESAAAHGQWSAALAVLERARTQFEESELARIVAREPQWLVWRRSPPSVEDDSRDGVLLLPATQCRFDE